MIPRRHSTFWQRMGRQFDGLLTAVAPRTAYQRQRYRFAYEILDGHRLRRQRSLQRRGGDQELSERNLDKLREIHRDLATNNPLVKGIYRKLATAIVGTSTRIQIRTDDEEWNKQAEAAIKTEMVEQPCDITGRFTLHAYLKKTYYRYAIDGDCFTLLTDQGPQAKQGECCGTPYGKAAILQPKNFVISNGVAVSKRTSRVIGYYIGTPNKWGYIRADSYKQYPAERVHHLVNFERFDHSRGEPMLLSSVDWIDKGFGYADAEVVAAKINACFPMVAKTYDQDSMRGLSGTIKTAAGTDEKDEYERPLVRMEPGQIWEGEPGEELSAVGAARPAPAFDAFFMRILCLIGSPVGLPLMLLSGDFSAATFMNSRFAYNEARDFWRDEQELVLKPHVRTLILWKLRELIDRKVLSEREDWNRIEIYCKRWPYIDPYREAQADKLHLENGTTSRTKIVARQDGQDWSEEVWPERVKEEKQIEADGVVLRPQKSAGPQSNERAA